MDSKAPEIKRGIINIITVVLIALRLDGIITCSWCWVLIPWAVLAFISWIIDIIALIIYYLQK